LPDTLSVVHFTEKSAEGKEKLHGQASFIVSGRGIKIWTIRTVDLADVEKIAYRKRQAH
jgi:hypothetical protein